MEGYPADKDLRTQYEWAKAWNKKGFQELGLDAAADWSDTDKGRGQQGGQRGLP